MNKQKSLSHHWLPKILALLLLSGCYNSRPMSIADQQNALQLVDQGTVLLRQGRLAEAQGAFAAAAEFGPIAAAIDGLGCVAFMRKDFSAAEKYFVLAYEMDREYDTSLSNLALLYEVNGLSERANQVYQMAIELEPENFRTRNNFAVYLFDKDMRADRGHSRQAGGPREAKEELLKALALAKHPMVARNVNKLEEYE